MTFAMMRKILNQKVKRQRDEEKLELKIGIQTDHDRMFLRHTEWDSIL